MRVGGGPVDVTYLDGRSRRIVSPEGSADILVTGSAAIGYGAGGEIFDPDAPVGGPGLGAESLHMAEEKRMVGAVGWLRQVGIGGAKYGADLYRKTHTNPNPNADKRPRAIVLGYGNVAMGAFEYLRSARISFTVLGCALTSPSTMPRWLRSADLVVNGAESACKGEYLITDEHTGRDLRPGSVVIDLIGGSPALRSPIEAFEWTTFLPDIHFERDGRYFAGLWGWDMYHSMPESAVAYSRMIKTVLLESEKYAESLEHFLAAHDYAVKLGGAGRGPSGRSPSR